MIPPTTGQRYHWYCLPQVSGINDTTHHWFNMVINSVDLTFRKVTDSTKKLLLRSRIIFMRVPPPAQTKIFMRLQLRLRLYTIHYYIPSQHFKTNTIERLELEPYRITDQAPPKLCSSLWLQFFNTASTFIFQLSNPGPRGQIPDLTI
jgi:hypothetical protein